MHILIFSQFYFPETNAPAHRISFFAEYLKRKGEEATVICEPPNYPERKLFKGYKNKWRFEEEINNVKIIRSWVYITKRKSFFPRIVNYASFAFSSFFAGMREKRPDIIFATSPPFPTMASAWLVSKLRGVPLVIDVRDIWPDSAVAVGMMKRGTLFKVLEWWEKLFYRRAQKIIVNAKGIGRRLVEDKKVLEEKIEFLPNGADLEIFNPEDEGKKIEKEFELKNKFVVFFVGLIGLAQNPQIIIETAKILKGKQDIRFLIVGNGPVREECLSLIEEYNLKNVIMPGSRPRKEVPEFTARADVCLATHKKDKLFTEVIPSKIFDYMAGSRPIVINSEGEGAKIVKEADCGLKAEITNSEDLAEKILEIYNNPEKGKKLGRNGRVYAKENFSKKEIAGKLQQILKSVASSKH